MILAPVSSFDPAAWSTLVTALGVGVVSVIGSLNITKKLDKNQSNVEITLAQNHVTDMQSRQDIHGQLTDLTSTTEKIHDLANGNLSKLNSRLEEANAKIEALSGLSPNFKILGDINLKLDKLSSDLVTIRQRQHDLADFIHEQGIAFQLKSLPDLKSLPEGEKKV
jgi:hypothetical protein